jgi:GNAT superfamily N-acetyltransferase
LHSLHSASYSPFVNEDKITFVPLSSPGTIQSAELQKRAASRANGKYTRHFIAMENAAEVAFVSLDFLPVDDALGIYELYIPGNIRGRGIGGRLLDEIETMAKQQGYSKVRLAARPMAGDSQPQLEAWYAKRGYVCPPDSLTAVLEKTVK